MTLALEDVPDYWLEPPIRPQHRGDCDCYDCHTERDHEWRDWWTICEWCLGEKQEYDRS